MYRTRKTEKRYALQRRQAKAAGIRCDFCEFTSTHPQVKEEFSHFWVARNNFPYSVWDGCDVADHVMIVPNATLRASMYLRRQSARNLLILSQRTKRAATRFMPVRRKVHKNRLRISTHI